jgi:hypothetical protein
MTSNMHDNTFTIRPYTPQELAASYRCTTRTMYKWLQHLKKELGPRVGHTYNPRQVKIIVEQLGAP